MGDGKGKSGFITIMPVTEAILTDGEQTLLVHVLDIQWWPKSAGLPFYYILVKSALNDFIQVVDIN